MNIIMCQVLIQFEKRRRRWLVSAQSWSAATTLGSLLRIATNPEGVRLAMNPFRVNIPLFAYPGLSLRSNPGLGLANAFGVMTRAGVSQYPVSYTHLTLPTSDLV